MPRLVPIRLAAACALAIALLVSAVGIAQATTPVARKAVSVELRVVNAAGRPLAQTELLTGTTKVPTSPKANCLGKGTGGSGKAVTVKGPTALGALAESARFPGTRPLLVTDHFLSEFGLGLCGVGGYKAHGSYSWYLKVNHKNPELGGDSVKLKAGDEVLWALAKFPYPNELSLVAPEQATPGVPFTVQVFSYNDKGKKKPASGATVTGAMVPTGADGTTTVVLPQSAVLKATRGRDIPSRETYVSACAGVCPVAVP